MLLAVALTFAGSTRAVLYLCTISGDASLDCCCEGGDVSHAGDQGCCDIQEVKADPAPTPSVATLTVPPMPVGPVPAAVPWPSPPRPKAIQVAVALGPRGPPAPPPAPLYLRIRTLLI